MSKLRLLLGPRASAVPPAEIALQTVATTSTAFKAMQLTSAATIPDGNAVTLTDASALPFELMVAPLYAPVLVGPSAGYNGTAGSGFGGVGTAIPLDPTRTTAKPALRIVEVPGQRFATDLVVGFIADGKTRPAKVIAHCEGTQTDILSETLRIWTDANGRERALRAYWFSLDVSAFLALSASGNTVSVYAEAVPSDGTMQNRVVGPYSFYPEADEYEETVHFGSALPKDLVSSPKTFPGLEGADGALQWARGGKHNVRLICQTTGTYNMTTVSGTPGSRGFITIEAALGVTCTIGKASYTTDALALMRPALDRLRFRGSNVVIDYANMTTVYAESTSFWHWFDGCTMTNSNGRDQMWRKGLRPSDQTVRWAGGFFHYFTEVYCSNLPATLRNAALVRNCRGVALHGDIVTASLCVVGLEGDDLNNVWWRTEFPALTVTYSGAATTATVAKTGINDANGGHIILAENGATVLDITLQNTEGGSNYNVSDVKALIDAQAGWSAAIADADLYDVRRATALSKAGTAGWGAFAATNAKGSAVNLVTAFDVHGDVYQCTAAQTNIVLRDWALTNLQQMFVIFFDAICTDFIVSNVAAHSQTNDQSQLFNGSASHLVLRNITLADQTISMLSGFAPDAYCEISECLLRGLQWSGTPDADITIDRNHFINGSIPSGATNSTTGSTAAALLVDAANGDFEPQGALLTNTVSPRFPYDMYGATKPTVAVIGAKAARLVSGSLTKADVQGLVMRTSGATPANDLGPVVLRWKAGAGETGAQAGVDATVNIAA